MYDNDDLGLSPEFLADECIARDMDEYDAWHGQPSCGGPCYEYGQNTGCQGCKHCDPPDLECRPYEFGIERFEQQEMLQRARQLIHWWPLTCELTWHRARELAFKWSGYDERLEARARRYWDRCCDECETHREAKDRYRTWAMKAAKNRQSGDVEGDATP